MRIHLASATRMPSPSFILEMLEGCLLLEELDLSNLFEVFSAEDYEPRAVPIELSHLSYFQYYSVSGLGLSSLWLSIKVPSSAQLRLESPAVAGYMVPALPHIRELLNLPYDTLRVSFNEDNLVLHIYSSNSGALCDTVTRQEVPAGVSVRLVNYRTIPAMPDVATNLVLAALLRVLDPAQIRHLDIDIVFNMPNFPEPTAMRETLRALTRMETLTIGHLAHFQRVVDFLTESLPDQQTPLSFPSLHTIIFKDASTTMPSIDSFAIDSAVTNMKKTWMHLAFFVIYLYRAGCDTLRRIRVTELNAALLFTEPDHGSTYAEVQRRYMRELESNLSS